LEGDGSGSSPVDQDTILAFIRQGRKTMKNSVRTAGSLTKIQTRYLSIMVTPNCFVNIKKDFYSLNHHSSPYCRETVKSLKTELSSQCILP
jgi:hypothetical protein